MPAPISFRSEIDALIETGAPMTENQATPVVTNTQALFERVADKCDALNDQCLTLEQNKANTADVFSKTDVDTVPTDNSSNLLTSGTITKLMSKSNPRIGVEDTKTVLMFSNGSRQILDIAGILKASNLPDTNDLVGLYLGTAVTYVDTEAFYYCGNLEVVDAPKVTSIGNKSFYRCLKLKTVSAPSLEYLHSKAFNECSSLQVIDFGSTLQTVPILENEDGLLGVPTSCALVVPNELAEEWRETTPWSTYESMVHSQDEWKIVHKYEILNMNIGQYLEPIRQLTLIGDGNYDTDDLKNRLDVIITTLKSIGTGKIAGLEDVTPIGDNDYVIDDVRSRLDAVITALQKV